MGAQLPKARIEPRDTAGKMAQLGAVARHRAVNAGRVAGRIGRGLFTAGCGFGALFWIGMHSSTNTHRYNPDIQLRPVQLPKFDSAQFERELQSIEMSRYTVQVPPLVMPPIAPMSESPEIQLLRKQIQLEEANARLPIPVAPVAGGAMTFSVQPGIAPAPEAPPAVVPVTSHDLQHALLAP